MHAEFQLLLPPIPTLQVPRVNTSTYYETRMILETFLILLAATDFLLICNDDD